MAIADILLSANPVPGTVLSALPMLISSCHLQTVIFIPLLQGEGTEHRTVN